MGLLQQTSQSTLRTLFHSATKEEYEEKLCERQHTWDATFEAYYMHARDPSDVPSLIAPRLGGGFLKSTTNTIHTVGWQPTSRRDSTGMHTQIQVYAYSQSWFVHSISTETEVIMLPSLSLDLCMWNWAWIGMMLVTIWTIATYVLHIQGVKGSSRLEGGSTWQFSTSCKPSTWMRPSEV